MRSKEGYSGVIDFLLIVVEDALGFHYFLVGFHFLETVFKHSVEVTSSAVVFEKVFILLGKKIRFRRLLNIFLILLCRKLTGRCESFAYSLHL